MRRALLMCWLVTACGKSDANDEKRMPKLAPPPQAKRPRAEVERTSVETRCLAFMGFSVR